MSGEVCSIPNPESVGNMYYRGEWEFCPEYRVGDVVLCNGALYLAKKPHAGRDPTDKGNADYWQGLGNGSSGQSRSQRVIDGGYASTGSGESYAGRIDGGNAGGRVHVPLI